MKYQVDYAAGRKQMYDIASREQKGIRMIKTLGEYFGHEKLKRLSVLDVGASTGIIDNVLAGKFKSVIGIDIDKEAIKHAKENFKKSNLKFKVDDAMKLSFADQSFDVVICAHVYEHVPSDKKLFEEIYRVLKPGGVSYLAAVNALWPWESHYDLPFLSWLPKKWANWYVRISGKAKEYYETPKNYWQLRRMLNIRFRIYEYTQKIIDSPETFGYPKSWNLFGPVSFLAIYFSPTLFWILEK